MTDEIECTRWLSVLLMNHWLLRDWSLEVHCCYVTGPWKYSALLRDCPLGRADGSTLLLTDCPLGRADGSTLLLPDCPLGRTVPCSVTLLLQSDRHVMCIGHSQIEHSQITT